MNNIYNYIKAMLTMAVAWRQFGKSEKIGANMAPSNERSRRMLAATETVGNGLRRRIGSQPWPAVVASPPSPRGLASWPPHLCPRSVSAAPEEPVRG